MLQGKVYFFKLIIWLIGISLAGWCLFEYIIPQLAFSSYFAIPAVILSMGTVFYFILQKVKTLSAKHAFMWFLMNTAIKMFVSIVFVVCAILYDKKSMLTFTGTYLVFYMLLLLFETYWFARVSKYYTDKQS